MQQMKIFASSILAIFVFLAFSIFAQATDSPTIKFGALLPLSGDLAQIGESARDAILLAKEETQKAPGKKYRYEVIFEDDQMTPMKSIIAFRKLADVDGVSAILALGSGVGNALLPLTEQKKVIQLNWATDPHVATGTYSFTHALPPAEGMKTFLELAKIKKAQRIAVIAMNHQWPQALVSELKKQTTGTSFQICDIQYFNSGTRDFRTLIAKQKATSPDLILVLAFSPEFELITDQLNEMGLHDQISSIEAIDMAANFKQLEGVSYVGQISTDQFRKNFSQRFGREPFVGAANYYDMFNLLVTACEQSGATGKPTSTQISDSLKQIQNFSGALGPLTILPSGIIESSAVFKQIKDGKPVVFSP